MKKQTLLAWGVAILCFVVLMIVTPAIHQSEAYHDFADQREFLVSIMIYESLRYTKYTECGFQFPIPCNWSPGAHTLLSQELFLAEGEVWGWSIFFIGVAAVAIGSSYYHLKPNDARLVWDRLPMTIAFTSIMAIFIIERINEQKGTVSIILLLLAGVISILYWRFFDDLRPYALIQFVPCIAIPLMAILLPPMYTHSAYWLWAAGLYLPYLHLSLYAGFYLLAKVEEAADKPIYKWTHHIVSGHTLKHLCAAMVPVLLALMLAKRSNEAERQSLLETWKVSWTRFRGKDEVKVESYTCAYSDVPVEESP
ncbi:hypothetical protein RHGRI_014126 [Rhododendron griersonianum]|uniref:Ceramidase n=1 Tax=Rhododendron griersonianum TaxID=479676 RepID=A0AAV6K864_9ERIC|nr:hypothetical protein RHGRI_014126 [Rhododendron griersonianum]